MHRIALSLGSIGWVSLRSAVADSAGAVRTQRPPHPANPRGDGRRWMAPSGAFYPARRALVCTAFGGSGLRTVA
eukprot:5654876-Pyramimonas_sp.AAC.1